MKALKAITLIVCTIAVLLTCTVVVVTELYPDLIKKNSSTAAVSQSANETVQSGSPDGPSMELASESEPDAAAESDPESDPVDADEPSSPESDAEDAVDYQGVISEPSEFKYNRNSADGITLTWMATNQTDQTINYYTVHLRTINPVGDPSYDQNSGESSFDLKYVGPVEPGGTLIVYQLFTYQGALDSIVIDDIDLQYADGTKQTVRYGFQTSDDSGMDKY